MTQKIDPFLQTKWGWNDGDNAWGNGMNENLIKFSFLLNRRLDGIVGSISSTPASDGLAYFLTTDKHVYFSGDGVWYNTALPIGFELIMKADESHYEYNGTTLVPSSVSGVVAWADITGKPSTFTPSAHTHVISDVTGLQTALDAKVDKVGGKGLSTEDYTTAEKTKLSGIATGAEANTISSVGVGTASLVSGKVGVDLQIKSLVAGSNISFSQTGDEVTINSSTGGVGVVNSVNGYTGTVVLTNADLGATPTTRTLTAGNGLTGGGDLSANRTFTLGTPSSISTASTNSSSAGTHSHLLVLSAADIGAVDLTTLNTRLGTSGNLGTLALQNANSVTISGGTINNTPIGATTRSTGNFTNIDANGNLTLSGTAKKIIADFSDAAITNRLAVQTSVTNGGTHFSLLPNGTGNSASFRLYTDPAMANSAIARFALTGSGLVLASESNGTGILQPISLLMQGVAGLTLDISNNTNVAGDLNLNGAGKRIKSDFSNATILNRTLFQTTTSNATTSVGIIPNGTNQSASIVAFNNSDPTNASFARLFVSNSEVKLDSGTNGTGTYLPLNLYTNGVLQLSIAINGTATFSGSVVTSGGVTAASYSGAGVSSSSSANTLVKRDGAGDIYANNISALGYIQATGNIAAGGYVQATYLNLIGSAPTLIWKDNNSPVASMTPYMSFQDNTNAEVGWFGYGAGNGEMGINNSSRIIRAHSPVVTNSSLDVAGVLTATGGTNLYSTGLNVLNLNTGNASGQATFQVGGAAKGYITWATAGFNLYDSNANLRIQITNGQTLINGLAGSGSALTSLDANNITTGTLSNSRLAFTINTSSSASTVVQRDGNGDVYFNNVFGNSFAGNGVNLTALNATQLTSGTVPTARLPTASTSAAGIVQLSDSTGSPSSTTAATSLAVNTAANTASTANNTANNAISRLDGQYQAPFQLLNILGNVSGTATITASSGTHVKATCVGNTTWVFPSVASGNAMALTLELTNGGAGTQTWPSGTLWAGGVQPTWTVSGKDRVVFTKAGTDPWLGALAGKGFA